VEEARTVISLSAGNEPRGYDMLARLFHDQGNLDSCTSLLDYGLTQYPMDAELMLLRGYLWEYQGRFDEAEKIYQRILAFRPDFENAALALSTIGEKTAPGVGGAKISPMDRSQLAWEILEPLVEKYPENLPLKEALGRAYLKGRQFDRARSQFQEIQKIDPEYPDIQQRIQESNITRPAPITKNDGLTANLNRTPSNPKQLQKNRPTSFKPLNLK
jgi:tetratricopeptide (TPR) repeat protein